ncbi:unnamed protein product [Plutella xylostella]|uniref:(diamondback moth) hypothetical protein n=1 Tax=Plutella xylostella TaxID=51655 RepID=A0A8S4FYW5_PLUXY|nr:unnamed protein product [Plutella xylostella]
MMMLQRNLRRNTVMVTNIIRTLGADRGYSTNQINSEQIKGEYDIIIAGGGMVGCTLACSMGKNKIFSNLKVLLLEGSPDKPFELKPEYSNRVVALNQNTKALMNSMNIWSHVENMRLQPVRHMQVWDACSDALITFSSSEIMDDDVAYIVENDVLLHAVNTELKSPEVSNVNVVYGAKIANYELPKTASDSRSLVRMGNGDVYSCQLLRYQIDWRYIEMLRCLYNAATMTVQVQDHKTRPIQLKRGVRQVDVISPKLFTNSLDVVKTLDWKGHGICINGEYMSHLRVADDIVIMAESLQELSWMLSGLNAASPRVGLGMNLDKTKVMYVQCSHETGAGRRW